MPLVKGGRIVADDFTMLDDEAPLPTGASVFVSAARFLADPQAHLQATNRLGVVLPNSRRVDDLVPWLGQLAAIALVFPGFRDGRAYSQARLLREVHGFGGELRATGQVLRDQFLFMLRSGFDAFAVKKDSDASVFADVARRYSVFYQPTADGRPVAAQRRELAPAAGR